MMSHYMVYTGVMGISPFSWRFDRAKVGDDDQQGVITIDNERDSLKHNHQSQIFQTISTGKISISADKCHRCDEVHILIPDPYLYPQILIPVRKPAFSRPGPHLYN
jgi:hypothetical protein